MSQRIRASELPEFDAAMFLEDEQAIKDYLSAVTEENDPVLLAAALEDIARARQRKVGKDSNTGNPGAHDD